MKKVPLSDVFPILFDLVPLATAFCAQVGSRLNPGITIRRISLLAFVWAMLCHPLGAAVPPMDKPFLHGLFTDNMILQRDTECPVWGWTAPGETVTVEMNGKKASAVAGDDGRWEARIGPFPAGRGYELKVNGAKSVTLKNVVTGDVWLCSGQSNMQMGMNGINQWWDEQGSAEMPDVRLAFVPFDSRFSAPNSLDLAWKVSTKDNVFGRWPTSGGFSAIAFLFGRELHRQLGIPIGLIESCWGATSISSWGSPEAVKGGKELAGRSPYEAFLGRVDSAWKEMDPNYETSMKWIDPGYDVSGWSTQNLPRDKAAPDAGTVEWFRKDIEVPESWVQQDLIFSLGPVDSIDTLWWNGVMVDSFSVTDNYRFARYYQIPAALVRKGRQAVTLRVSGRRGVSGEPSELWLRPARGNETPMPLAGEWKFQAGTPMEQLKRVRYPERRTIEAGCYQAMIAPLAPFAIKGVIWYQGEGDVGRAGQYYDNFTRMIADWRTLFRNEKMPFYFVQLAGFGKQPTEPTPSGWVGVRDAQRRVADDVPNTGMAVAIDRGEIYNIHPPNKQDVARRLALAALAGTYGKPVSAKGPTFRTMKQEGNTLRLEFDHAEGGLVSKGGGPTGFAIAGPDGKFVWAQAILDGSAVVISSPLVPAPKSAQYGWAENPVCNLYNKDDLPAIPFQSEL